MSPRHAGPLQYLAVRLLLITAAGSSGSTLSGTLLCQVFDKGGSIPVCGAAVCIEELAICDTSDTAGQIRLKGIPTGIHALTVSATGYATLRIPGVPVDRSANLYRSIELSRPDGMATLDTLTITERLTDTRKAEQTASVARLDAFHLQHTAGTANDVCQALRSLPSVVGAAADNQTALFVRGGHSLENCFIVDGIVLGTISHFSDRTSSGGTGAAGFIDGAFIRSLDFYAGSIPASLPARMSAIADIRIREGSRTDFRHKIEAAIAGLGLTTEGPLFRQRGSYLITGRYLDLRPLKSLMTLNELGRSGDGLVKFFLQMNPRHSLNLTTVGAFDYVEPIHADPRWDYKVGFLGSGLQWNYTTAAFNNRMTLSVVGRKQWWTSAGSTDWCDSQTVMRNDDSINDNTGSAVSAECFTVKSRLNRGETIGDYSYQLKNDAVWYLRDRDQLGLGLHASRYRFNYTYDSRNRIIKEVPNRSDEMTLDSLLLQSVDFEGYDTSAGGYLNYVFREGRLKIVAGCRADYYRNARDCGISPRGAGSFELQHAGTFSLSAGLYYQYQAGITDIYNAIGSIRSELPGDPPGITGSDIELQRSWQGVLAWEKPIGSSHGFSVETYYKWYDREYTLADPTTFRFEQEYRNAVKNNRPWRLAPPRGKKKACGVELSFRKNRQSGFHYNLGYTLFSVKNRYADGRWYNDSNNVRNSGVVSIGYEFPKHHGLSLRANFHEGRPFTRVTGSNAGKPVYDTQHAYLTERYEPYLLVSVRYGFSIFPKFGTVTGYIDIWNLFNKKHVYWRTPEGGTVRGNGILPLLGMSVEF